ncbi:MAG: MFS transporter [Bacteroidota bacterium]
MSRNTNHIIKDKQYYKFCLYGFLKNLRFFEPFLIIFFLQKGLSFIEIGTLYAIREIAINIFEVPSGVIADALGRRKTLASSFLVYIVAFIFFYLGQGFLLFGVAMILYAVGDAVRSGINKALIISYLERTGQSELRVGYYGHTRSWSQFGSAISSLIAGFLVFFNEDLNTIFLFSVVPYLIDFLNVLAYPKYLDEHTQKNISLKKRIAETTNIFILSVKNTHLLKTLINASIYGGFYKSVKDFIQPFLKSSIMVIPVVFALNDHEKLSILLGLTYFLMFIANGIASRNAEKIKNLFKTRAGVLNTTLLVGAIVGIVSGSMMIYWVYPIIIIAMFILLLLIENLRKPSAVAEITIIGEKEVHASVLSVMSQLTSLFTAGFVLIIGFIADHYDLGWGIIVISLILAISFPITRLFNENKAQGF